MSDNSLIFNILFTQLQLNIYTHTSPTKIISSRCLKIKIINHPRAYIAIYKVSVVFFCISGINYYTTIIKYEIQCDHCGLTIRKLNANIAIE